MTDNEIITDYRKEIEKPRYLTVGIFWNVLDLIERQQAEIERLNSCVKSEDEIRAIMKDQMSPMVKEIVNEQIDSAIKLSRIYFAERLKERMHDRFLWRNDIDNLLKEMEKEHE